MLVDFISWRFLRQYWFRDVAVIGVCKSFGKAVESIRSVVG